MATDPPARLFCFLAGVVWTELAGCVASSCENATESDRVAASHTRVCIRVVVSRVSQVQIKFAFVVSATKIRSKKSQTTTSRSVCWRFCAEKTRVTPTEFWRRFEAGQKSSCLILLLTTALQSCRGSDPLPGHQMIRRVANSHEISISPESPSLAHCLPVSFVDSNLGT